MARNSPLLAAREEAPRAPCSWEGCTARAHLRAEIEPGKGMHNLCEFHYVQACHRASERRVRDELGLKTVAQMKAFCRTRVKTIFNRKRNPIEYWERVLAQAPRGSIAERSAKECLAKLRGREIAQEREPGSDDEPVSLAEQG